MIVGPKQTIVIEMRTAIVVVLLSLFALYFFNPGMDEFKLFVQEQSERLLQRELGDNLLGRALSGAGSRMAGSYIERITDRNDYLFFSTYTIDLDGPDREAEEWRFLGIAGLFVETQSPQSAENLP